MSFRYRKRAERHFAAVFGSLCSANHERPLVRIIAEPGLSVTLRKERSGSRIFLKAPRKAKPVLALGSQLTFRTQAHERELAVESAHKQLRRRYPHETSFDWETVNVERESYVVREHGFTGT